MEKQLNHLDINSVNLTPTTQVTLKYIFKKNNYQFKELTAMYFNAKTEGEKEAIYYMINYWKQLQKL